MSLLKRVLRPGVLLAGAGFLMIAPLNLGWGQQSTPPAVPSAQAAPVGSDEVVLTIGEKKFTAAEFEKIVAALPPQFRATLPSLGKKGFAEQFANLYALAMEGEKRQLDQTEEFQQMMDFDRRVLLAQVAMTELAAESGAVGIEEVNYYYQTHQQDFEQVKVTGIYIPFAPPTSASKGIPQTISAKPEYTEQQAQRKALELRARIQAGQNMAALAKTDSEHPTASKGGDFGYFGRNQNQTQLPPGILNALFSLQPNKVSAPLKDRYGFFIFRVEDKRVQPIEELQEAIQASLGRQKLNRRIETVQESYPVVMNPNYFTEAPAAKTAAPGPGSSSPNR